MVYDSLSYQSPFTNFQTGLNTDATDDFIASALAGGSVAPLSCNEYVRGPWFLCLR